MSYAELCELYTAQQDNVSKYQSDIYSEAREVANFFKVQLALPQSTYRGDDGKDYSYLRLENADGKGQYLSPVSVLGDDDNAYFYLVLILERGSNIFPKHPVSIRCSIRYVQNRPQYAVISNGGFAEGM